MDAPAPPPTSAARASVAPLTEGGAERVVRLRLRPGGPSTALEDLKLYTGELTEAASRRITLRDVPETLLGREVPLLCWLEVESGDSVCAPSVPLELGASYSFAALGQGQLLGFQVTATGRPLLTRFFPSAGAAGSGWMVLCGDALPEAGQLLLEPFEQPAQFEPDWAETAQGQRCGRVTLLGQPGVGEPVLLPASLGSVLLDPTPLWIAEAVVASAACAETEIELGPGCAEPQDDRVLLRGVGQPLVWRLEQGGARRLERTGAFGRFWLRGLVPDSEQRLEGQVFDAFGGEASLGAPFRTQAPRPHWVLNEVLSNPFGVEPVAEWIELFNDGDSPAELAGIRLEDASGGVDLPAARVEAGAHLLLARDDFGEADPRDVPLAENTQIVRLPSLAKGGLSNSGEALTLRAADGRALSRFPPIAAPHAGVSLARRRPDAFDDDPTAFAEHAAPGASPGAPNQLAP